MKNGSVGAVLKAMEEIDFEAYDVMNTKRGKDAEIMPKSSRIQLKRVLSQIFLTQKPRNHFNLRRK